MVTGASQLQRGARRHLAEPRAQWLTATLLGLLCLTLSAPAQATKIKDLSTETPRQREAHDQVVAGNHDAVVKLLDDAAMKQLGRRRNAAESALLGQALAAQGALKAARKVLRSCDKKPVCARTLGDIELTVGDPRRGLKTLGAAFKRHPKDVRLRLAFGAALYAAGQGYQARQLLDPLADLYARRQISEVPELVAVARSLALNGFYKDANQVIADANEAAANKAEQKLVNYWWGTLFLDKTNFRDADKSFRQVLAIDPSHVPSVVAMARIDLDSDHAPRKAKKRLDKALKRTPLDPRLLAVRAEVALADEDLPAAMGFLDAALKISPTHRHTLAVRYATCALRDDARCMKRALKTLSKANKFDAHPHLVAARYLETAHRYDRVLQELKLALKRDPDSAKAHAALGMSYARLADDKKAFAHLETAFRTDRYNVRTANVLNVLYDGVLRHMQVIEGEFVDLRVHRRHRRALERTMLPFLQESYEVLSKKYAMKAKPPLRVEVFETSEQFSVRTVGLPQLGAHAVCFGHLITSRSPTERPFNWKMVLHHELAHVFHIQATDGRVPRWLTEGLAMMESVWLDGRYHMIMERRLYSRWKARKLAKVRTFNLAFSQARSMREIGDAYYQAMKLTRYLDERYGFAKLRKLVAAHKSGKPTAALVKRVLGVTPEQLDADFSTWLGKHLARFERDFRPDRVAIEAMLKAAPKQGAKAAGAKVASAKGAGVKGAGVKGAGAKGAGVTTPQPPLAPALRETMQALKGGDVRRAMATLTRVTPTDKVPKTLSPTACAAYYVAMDLALAKRDWKRLAGVSQALIDQPGGRCDGVRQRVLRARALRALGKDRRTEVLLHLRKAAEIDPRDVSVKRFWLAALPKTAPDNERRRLVREILDLSPNEVKLGEVLAALAWKDLRASLGLTPPNKRGAGVAKGAGAKVPGVPGAPGAAQPGAAQPGAAQPGASHRGGATSKPAKPLDPRALAALARDVQRGALQLEETAPHTYAQALWEARAAVTRGGWKMAVPVYRLAAERAEGPKQRRLAWCELARVAERAKAKEAGGEAQRRCKAETAGR